MTPGAFRAALKKELHEESQRTGRPYQRLQTILTMERYLARLVRYRPNGVVLKGGLALEIRLARARTTQDIDIRYAGSQAALLTTLQAAGRLDLGDFLLFEVQRDAKLPVVTNPGQRYQGERFRVQAHLAGRQFQSFKLDVGIGDAMATPPDIIVGSPWLRFAGIAPPSIPTYPVVVHLAEKLHAYTFAFRSPNSRVKDLPDIALLGVAGQPSAVHAREAIRQTFESRGTHSVPSALPAPPAWWERPYAEMAATNKLQWGSLTTVFEAAAAFLDPLLSGVDGTWNPLDWTWTP